MTPFGGKTTDDSLLLLFPRDFPSTKEGERTKDRRNFTDAVYCSRINPPGINPGGVICEKLTGSMKFVLQTCMRDIRRSISLIRARPERVLKQGESIELLSAPAKPTAHCAPAKSPRTDPNDTNS